MPELPFIQVLAENLAREVSGRTITSARVVSPAILKTFDPPVTTLDGQRIQVVRRVGKIVVFDLSGDLVLAVHLMRDGRFQLAPRDPRPRRATARPPKPLAFVLDLDDGRQLRLVEHGPKKRAGVYVLRSGDAAAREPLAGLGADPLGDAFSADALAAMLRTETGQLKRVLTMQRHVTGIGNAFADEILWHAQLSPLAAPSRLTADEVTRLHSAIRDVLGTALERHRAHFGDDLPSKEPVELLRVHRHAGEPCPRCGTAIAAISYAEKETFYCPGCQTGGKVYADRRMSRLLK